MQKIKLSMPISISDHCNLNCDGCYTLSNYDLKGHQYWDDFKEIFLEWSKKIDLVDWSIYGGEPTLNPTILDWLKGICDLWPESTGLIATNGYTLGPSKKSKQLYDFLAKQQGQIYVHISLHDIDNLDQMVARVRGWLQDVVSVTRAPALEDILNSHTNWSDTYNSIRGTDWPLCDSWDEFKNLPLSIQKECDELFNFSDVKFADKLQGYKFTDINGVVVLISKIHWHSQGPLLPQPDFKTFKLHSSDPNRAHDACANKFCSEIYKGKIYKCNTVGHFATFDQQFNIELTDDERNLLHSYNPCSSSASITEIQEFLENLKNPLPQCTFCSEELVMTEIHSSTKKIIFQKKIDKT